MRFLAGILFVLVVALTSPVASPGQQPAPKTNPVPLEKPEPLARLKAADPAQVMTAIVGILRQFSYQIDRSNLTALDARRLDTPSRPDAESEYDRVIIWLERDFDRPLEYVKIYFLWGRYEMVWGQQRGICRVVPWTERDIPRLKAAIAELAQQ